MMKSLNLEDKTFFLVETLWTGSGSSLGSPWRLSGFVCSFPSVSGVISSVSVSIGSDGPRMECGGSLVFSRSRRLRR